MKKITKFNDFKINELYNSSLTEEELFEMSNYWGDTLGLDENIVLWIGSAMLSKHGNRIKVSNIPGKSMGSHMDCFTITIPDLKIIGNVNKKHITNKKLNSIFNFIKLNEELIIEICEQRIDTGEFLKRLKKYEN